MSTEHSKKITDLTIVWYEPPLKRVALEAFKSPRGVLKKISGDCVKL
jgi:hypothetical protein